MRTSLLRWSHDSSIDTWSVTGKTMGGLVLNGMSHAAYMLCIQVSAHAEANLTCMTYTWHFMRGHVLQLQSRWLARARCTTTRCAVLHCAMLYAAQAGGDEQRRAPPAEATAHHLPLALMAYACARKLGTHTPSSTASRTALRFATKKTPRACNCNCGVRPREIRCISA
jgi:hypothetical protein